MSGGSFNYLYCKDAVQIIETCMPELEQMAVELEGLGFLAEGAAKATRALQERLRAVDRELNDEIQRLERVWHAVEWWRSCDYGKDQVFVAIGEYRQREKERR